MIKELIEKKETKTIVAFSSENSPYENTKYKRIMDDIEATRKFKGKNKYFTNIDVQ
ncbi:hypothetical protein [Mycoplasma yeatsii]|uniref:hypothetical protein n=1 Tax=Mycoplasma yeatsii TaxID=51365 RepID=UPI00130DEBBB|nr:hypothetical protein [Mycoplasma yeatsii]